jgi:hypothetical protein
MVGNAHNGHDTQNKPKRANMDRYEQNQRWDDHCAAQSLPWMKRHSRPRGGWPAVMMDRVRQLKPIGPVHETVRPIKPSVMDEKIDEH